MSIFLKTKPAGVDIGVQWMQNFLYAQLQKTWNIQPADYTCYGRAYRNNYEDGSYAPQVYTGANEYTDAFYDDTVKALSFFWMGEKETYNGGLKSPMSLIFNVDIEKLKPGFAYRADEEIRRDVLSHVRRSRAGFHLDSVEVGVSNVYREFTAWRTKYGIDGKADMHPRHCFRINFLMDAYLIQTC